MKFPSLNKQLPARSLLLFAALLFLLSLVSAWYFRVQPSTEYQRKALSTYIHAQEKDAQQLLSDTILLRKLVLKKESLQEFRHVEQKKYGVFLFAETIFDNQDLLFWNSQKVLPSDSLLSRPDGESFQQLNNGFYVVIKNTLRLPGMSSNIISFILIPVVNQYYLETDYLETSFVHDPDAIKKITLSKAPTPYIIRSLSNQPLFYIKGVAHSYLVVTDTLTIVLRIAALIFLLTYTHLMAEAVVKRYGTWQGILCLTLILILFRIILYKFPGIFSFRQFNLFNPLIYASPDWGGINSSLGDLLANAVLLSWVVLFAWYNIGPLDIMPAILRGYRRYAVGALLLFVLILSTFQLANVVQGLVANSKISFNVTDFFSLDVYTLVGFIVLALLCLSYYYFSRLLFRFIFPVFQGRFYYIYFIIALLGLVFLSFRSGNTIVLFHLPVLIWFLIYTLLVSEERFIINRFRITIAGALFWIFIFSVSLAVIILQGNRQNEFRIRHGIAEKLDQISDPSSERTLSIAITYLDNRFLVNNFSRFKDEYENRFLRDSIIGENFTTYINRFDTRIYVFDSLNNPVHNDDPATFASLNTIFTVQSKPTGIPDLYYHELSFDRFTYITKRTVRDSSGIIGSFFIISTPRQYGSTQALYPELFKRVSNYDVENSSTYAYAIYKNQLLISASSKYPFQITITNDQIPPSEFESRTNGDFDELWYKASGRKTVVIARKKDSVIESITLFSYLFCAFLFMVGFLQLMSLLIIAARDWRHFNFFARINIRTQIHGTVIFISILSFLIIGGATISFFIGRYNRNNIDKLSLTAGIMVKEMRKHLGSDTLTADSSFASGTRLQKLVNDVADIHNVDVNVYDPHGNLLVTSEEDVYRKGILSSKMNPLAYYHLNRLREVQNVQEEKVSALSYLSIYTVVRNEKGEVTNYLNIPYFSSQMDLKQEISNFLVAIINLNAFIFLVAGVIALFITNKITQSFSLIGDKMKEIRLGRTNEAIEWNRNDEIGELVKQYNIMVQQLEQSAEALAKSEREGAWREMARQVAHEIKNPLTPMKLSIQYLQKAINSGQGNIQALTGSVANTLVEQIDHLSKIAGDFSQFANISNRKVELVDLHQVLASLVNLFNANPRLTIHWQRLPGSIVMKADKTHMNRLFTNLLTNAVDACENQSSCLIEINEELQEDHIIVSIKDNGEGIEPEMRSRIFLPNFTTKTSGTGLGLAMCKSIAEQAQGAIWFHTSEGPTHGTTFFVKLPIIS